MRSVREEGCGLGGGGDLESAPRNSLPRNLGLIETVKSESVLWELQSLRSSEKESLPGERFSEERKTAKRG